MTYKKIEKDNYNLHIINTDKFKTVNVSINFKRKLNKHEITKRTLLNDLLINTSKKYKTTREIEIETEELYNLGIRSNSYKSGNYHIISFKEFFLNEKYTEKGMNKKSFEFLLDLIFNPNVENDKFDKENFDFLKSFLEDSIKSIQDISSKYSIIRLYEEMDKGALSYRTCGYLEDLDKITEVNLYEYYKKVIEEDKIDIFVIVHITEDVDKIFSKYIKNNHPIKNDLSHFIELTEMTKEQEKVEKVKTNQSNLAIGLRTLDLTDFELKYALNLYSIILGGSSTSRLFQTVREKNSLCYSINSIPSIIPKIITITAGINKDNYEKTIKLIKQEINKMKKDITEQELEEAKKIYISSCKEVNDSPNAIINNYLSYEYFGLDLADDRINNIKKVTKQDILNVANKIVIDKIFLLEGIL